MVKKFSFITLALLFSFSCSAIIKSQLIQNNNTNDEFQRSTSLKENGLGSDAPDALPETNHVPGFAFGGIPLDDSSFYEIRPEKCESESIGEIVGKYSLTDEVYLVKTDKGFIVTSLEQTLKNLDTGQRRKKGCPLQVGVVLGGELDCKGVRVIKESPFEGCAYEAKIWAHSLSEAQAFTLIYNKLRGQFFSFKKECVVPQKRSLSDRMIKF
ncbi:MAG TPA: hypothetical protein V6C96_03645 [Vampirovibrionales bacterium]